MREREGHLSSQACQAGEGGFKLKLAGKGNPTLTSLILVPEGDAQPGERSQVSKQEPEEQHKGLLATPANKPALPGAQLKCLYASVPWGTGKRS